MSVHNCPECRIAAQHIRAVADSLAAGAGAEIGLMVGGPRGALVGGQLGPELIERGALAIAERVKRKRSPKQKRRAAAMKKAMKQVNGKARTKAGKLKKGWSQSRIMREAHKDCHRRLK